MVAKRNNTITKWTPNFSDTRPHQLRKQPASSDWPEQISPLVHSSQTAWQLFDLGQSLEICFPHLLGHVG